MPDKKHPIGGPGGPGSLPIFEKKVLDSLDRIEKGVALANDRIQTLDNKVDLLIAKVQECCEDKPPPRPRPTGVQIDQVTHVH